MLFLLFHNVFYHLNIYNDEYGFNGEVSHLYTFKEYVTKCLKIIVSLHDQEQLLGGYWFLPQLLYASIIGFFIIKYINCIYIGVLLMLVVALLTSFVGFYVPYWGIRSLTFLSTTFFLIGFLCKKETYELRKWYFTVVFCFIVAIGSIFCYTSMLRFTTDKMLPYAVCAICGTVMTLNISQYIASKESWIKNLLVYVGNNTLTVLTWHFLCFKIVSLIIIQLYGLPIEQLACFPIIPGYASWWMAYFVVGAGVPLILKYGIRNL